MPDAKRLGASSRCYVAPVGTKLSDSWEQGGWKEIGYMPGWHRDESFEFMPDSSMLALQARINKAAHDYSMPSRWVMGIDPASNISPSNERNRPMGLTKKHEYASPQGCGRRLAIVQSDFDDHGAHIELWRGSTEESYTWTSAADAVPLALNVLGHDRPELGERRFPGDPQSVGPVVRSDSHREEQLALVAASLRAIDLYDQSVVKKKAADEAARAEAAKITAEAAKVRDIRRAEANVASWSEDIWRWGATADRVEQLDQAIAEYKAAKAA